MRHKSSPRTCWSPLGGASKKTAPRHLRRGDADLIHRALMTAAEVLERRAKGLNGLADELPRRAAKLRRLAAKIEAGDGQ